MQIVLTQAEIGSLVKPTDLILCAYAMSKAGFNAELEALLREQDTPLVVKGDAASGAEMAVLLACLEPIYQVGLCSLQAAADQARLGVVIKLPAGQLAYHTGVGGQNAAQLDELVDLLAPLFAYHRQPMAGSKLSRHRVIGLRAGQDWRILSDEAGRFLDEVLDMLGCDSVECYGEAKVLEWVEVLTGQREGRALSMEKILYSPDT